MNNVVDFNMILELNRLLKKDREARSLNPHMNKWKSELAERSITPIQQFRNTTGKNATDSALIIDAMDILYAGNVEGFCIVSSDGACRELNDYSKKQSWDFISSIYEECGYSSIDDCYDALEKAANLDDNSWGTPDTVSPDTYSSYDELYQKVRGHIDVLYKRIKYESHIVVYAEWHGDGSAINSDGKPAWEIYLLY